MPFEKGGRSDKMGNKYEDKCIIYEMLKVLREVNYSVTIEAIGEDEVGTDILITDSNGRKEHQQCKARNASKEYWSINDLKTHEIIEKWKKQLDRGDDRIVSLVSEVGCTHILDLHNRAINSNNNPQNFYDYQIKTASVEFQRSYKTFCEVMGLETSKVSDIAKSIDYLKRINIKQMSEYVLQQNIEQEISYYFKTDKKIVYNAFFKLIIDGNILGKEMTIIELRKYFDNQNICMRMLSGDKRIVSKIEQINAEYRKYFKPLDGNLIYRKEFTECFEFINNEQSFIISGKAGSGKSGCTEAVLNHCKKEGIPYIAIKLDKRIPHGNSEIWGEELGLKGSIVYALDAISKNKSSVLVLDQLDALRWTQANSNEALSVCMEMIRQVGHLNCNRAKKIIIVFVCREYDLRNDNNIKSLFEKERGDDYQIEWKKILINYLDESSVEKIVGEKYSYLTIKTKRLLQVSSNLYIWKHLEKDKLLNVNSN